MDMFSLPPLHPLYNSSIFVGGIFTGELGADNLSIGGEPSEVTKESSYDPLMVAGDDIGV